MRAVKQHGAGVRMATENAFTSKPADAPRAQRLSILGAARRVLNRDGAAELSLDAVAAEAGLATEAVNDHFHSAQEIVLSLAAEDLAMTAQAMRVNTRADHMGAAAVPEDGENTQGGARHGALLKRKSQMPVSLEQVMKEVAPDTNGSAGGVTPLARIERRIQMLEKAFAEIGERQEKALRERNDIAAAIDQNIASLRQRLDASDQSQVEIVTEIKKALLDVTVRINGIEVAALPRLAPNRLFVASGDPAQTVLDFAETPLPMPAPRAEEAPRRRSSDASENETYLSAARRAANEAVAAAASDDAPQSPPKRKRRGLGRFFLFACLAPMAIFATAIVALNRHTVTAETVHMTAPARAASAPPPIVLANLSDPTATEIAQAGPLAQVQTRAKTGDAKAERDLGLKYLAGDGVAADGQEAARWLLRSAYRGEPVAEYWLGTLYARGLGVPADAAQANHWYEAAAKQGNRRAMHAIGVAFLEGSGKDKNPAEAARWFREAAALGLADAAFNLGVLHERGNGVKQSLADAFTWYGIAAAWGDAPARARMDALAPRLHPADLASAQQASAAFKPKPLIASANLGG